MIEFSETQKKTIACGVTVLSLAVVFAFVALFGCLLVRVLSFLAPALTPVVFGLFLALFFRPYYALWLRIIKNPGLAAGVMLLSVLVPAGVLIWNFGSFIIAEVFDFLEAAPEIGTRLSSWIDATFPNARQTADSLGIPYADWLSGLKATAVDSATSAFGCVSGFLSGLVSLIFFVFFVTRPTVTGRDCVSEMPFLKEGTKAFVAEQMDAFLSIVVSFFQRQVVICLVEGLMYGLGFWLIGLSHGFLLGFLLGVLNLVPLFGSAVCLPMALPLAYWGPGGSSLLLIGVLSIWLAGQVLDGYLITPKIQGEKTGLGYAGVIFSFFFWGIVFDSLLGLLLAIPLSAFCVVLWRALKERYIKPVI